MTSVLCEPAGVLVTKMAKQTDYVVFGCATSVQRGIFYENLSAAVLPSVRLSIRHTRELHLSCMRYLNIFALYDRAMFFL